VYVFRFRIKRSSGYDNPLWTMLVAYASGENIGAIF
jgi:hypothetical protein